MLRFSIFLVLTASIPGGPAFAMSQVIHEDAKLLASDGNDKDHFGKAVSVYGSSAVVGAWHENHMGDPDIGAAYVYERLPDGTWQEQAKLEASDGFMYDEYGYSVAIFGDRVLVGAPGVNDLGECSGSTYVYERDAGGIWNEVAELHASDGTAADFFGQAVALFDDCALIGAPRADHAGSLGAGTVYVFERNGSGNWVEVAKLVANDDEAFDWFGISLSFDCDRAVVGADGVDDFGAESGAAYLFERGVGGTWTEITKLLASDASTFDEFGGAVSIQGRRAVVGARLAAGPSIDSGAAYLFERDGSGNWLEVAKLVATDGATNDDFGTSLALFGDRAVIGARWDSDQATNAGSGYVFERASSGAWVQVAELQASDAGPYNNLGSSVVVVGDRALLGAWKDDDMGTESGSAYVFELGLGETYCSSTANSVGAPAYLAATGSASVSANDLSLVAAPLPNQVGIFFFGSTQTNVAFGNGVRCAGGMVLRLPPQLAIDHVLSRTLDLAAPPLAGAVVPGSTWNAQAWFRDPAAGGQFFNTSSAISILFAP